MAGLADLKAPELKALLESVNADRDEADQIEPESMKKDDIASALEAAGIEAPATSEPASKGGYRVTAPLIAVKVGAQILQFHTGDILPGGVDEDSIKNLTDLGFIAES